MRLMATVRLTSLSHGAGCACKLGPGQLAEAMGGLSLPSTPPEVLIDAATSDDAAVYLPPGAAQAIVVSVDFFTPIVDDAFDWGRIAAANALSDLYAMGATPAVALNLVAWPADDLPMATLGRVLAGGVETAGRAGVAVVGGHSITDPEPKYGMCVVGIADPKDLVRNSTGRVGDRLMLTKPLGVGMISTAIKRGVATDAQIAAAVDTMTTLNAAAAAAMRAAGVSAATDVTGFGLLGHLREMLIAPGLDADLDADAVPVLPGVRELARQGVVAGGTRRNQEFVEPHVEWGTLPEAERLVLADAQTSGGLLIATSEPDALVTEFDARGVPWAEIGTLIEPEAATGPATGGPGGATDGGRIRIRGRLTG